PDPRRGRRGALPGRRPGPDGDRCAGCRHPVPGENIRVERHARCRGHRLRADRAGDAPRPGGARAGPAAGDGAGDQVTSEPAARLEMARRETTDGLDALMEALPPEICERLRELSNRTDLLEVVMDLGRRPEARFP